MSYRRILVECQKILLPLNAEDGLISAQIKDATQMYPLWADYFVLGSIGAHVEVGELGPNLPTTAYELLKGRNLHNDVSEGMRTQNRLAAELLPCATRGHKERCK